MNKQEATKLLEDYRQADGDLHFNALVEALTKDEKEILDELRQANRLLRDLTERWSDGRISLKIGRIILEKSRISVEIS